jgi:hypothetical protein
MAPRILHAHRWQRFSDVRFTSSACYEQHPGRNSQVDALGSLLGLFCASSLSSGSFFGKVQASVGFWVHRLTAKLLLLFAVLGNVVPVVQAAIPVSAPACCLRKAPHHCHDSTNPDSSRLVIRGTSCCGHECCRAVTTAQWAYPQPRGVSFSRQVPSARVAERVLDSPPTELSSSQSCRAPPEFTIG